MIISIKRLLEHNGTKPAPEASLLEASLQMGRAIIDGIATHTVWPAALEETDFRRSIGEIRRALQEPDSAGELSGIATQTVDALGSWSQSMRAFLAQQDQRIQSMVGSYAQQSRQMQGMIVMLTETIAQISGQSQDSVKRLHEVEKQIAAASSLGDLGRISGRLEECLRSVREAATQERDATAATVARLEREIEVAYSSSLPKSEPQGSFLQKAETDLPDYVAAFRLTQGDRIARRFGEEVRLRMLSMVEKGLRSMMGPDDELLSRPGGFVMFINSDAAIAVIRKRLNLTVIKIRQQYLDLGEKSALIALLVDWSIFPHAQYSLREDALEAMDSYLTTGSQHPQPAAQDTPAKSGLVR